MDGNLQHSGTKVIAHLFELQQTLTYYLEKGYAIQQVSVNWLVYWHNPETEKDVLVVLPELVLNKEG